MLGLRSSGPRAQFCVLLLLPCPGSAGSVGAAPHFWALCTAFSRHLTARNCRRCEGLAEMSASGRGQKLVAHPGTGAEETILMWASEGGKCGLQGKAVGPCHCVQRLPACPSQCCMSKEVAVGGQKGRERGGTAVPQCHVCASWQGCCLLRLRRGWEQLSSL